MKNRNLLMIPGPIEFTPQVLAALGAPTTSHLAPIFIDAFGQALNRLRKVVLSESGQAIVLAGTGTLAMDTAAANLIEPGDKAIVVNHGYFGDRYADILTRYGAQVTHVSAPVGGVPSIEEVEAVLKQDDYKLMTITHVDTSTGILADVKGLAKIGQKYGVLVVVDGVCSVAGEELRMDEWGLDVVLTASQKAIGVPPGLALLVVSSRAVEVFTRRKTQVVNYYADWQNWLPIMQAYQAGKPSYFATPAVNLIFALNVSLGQILDEGMEQRIRRHAVLSQACKTGIQALGLDQVPLSSDIAANTMTAPRFPDKLESAAFLSQVTKTGVILAGGLHQAIRTEYFRIGHMGAVTGGDILTTLGAVENALASLGYRFEPGVGLSAAQKCLLVDI